MTKVEDESTGLPTDLEQKIIRQVEYYFGDANMTRDKFLLEQVKKDDGWVSLDVLCTFNRLKQLSADHAVITTALKKSSAGLLQVSEDNTNVRRSPAHPLPELNKEKREEIASRTIYAKRFPLDATLDKLQDYFAQFGEVEQIQMRKNIKREFKGSVFVAFARKEDASKFLDTEAVAFNETTTLEARTTKDAYFKQKNEQRKQHSEEREKNRQHEMKRREDEEQEKISERITTGAVLRLTWSTGSLDVQSLKDFFAPHGKVAWVDAPSGSTEASVRFETGTAQAVWDAAVKAGEGSVVLKEVTVSGSVLAGDEEIDHWKKIFQDMKDHRDKASSGGRRGGRGGRGGRGRGRGRGGRNNEGRGRYAGKRSGRNGADSGEANVGGEEGAGSDEPKEKRVKVEVQAAAPVAEVAASVNAEDK